jgi:hypothetical protein
MSELKTVGKLITPPREHPMSDAEKRALLRVILDEVCSHIDQYHTGTRAHVAAKILAAAGRECTIEEIRKTGRETLRSDPTMWR